MSFITIDVPNEIYRKLEAVAAEREVSIEALVCDTLTEMMRQFEAYQQFLEMSRQG